MTQQKQEQEEGENVEPKTYGFAVGNKGRAGAIVEKPFKHNPGEVGHQVGMARADHSIQALVTGGSLDICGGPQRHGTLASFMLTSAYALRN